MATGTASPPGWPRDLPPPYSDAFAGRAVGWLLDRAPAGFRGQPALHSHPAALARIVVHTASGELAGLRDAYSAARRELADVLTPAEIERTLVALEAEGAVAAETLRELTLVGEALSGTTWRPRL